MMAAGQNRPGFLSGMLHKIRTVHFVWPPYAAGTLDSLSMRLTGPHVRRKKIIPSIPFINMGAFQEYSVRRIDFPHRPCHFLPDRIVLLQHQPPRIFLRHPVVRHHAYHIFSSVLIVEQRRVKSKIIQSDGIRPGPMDAFRRHQIIIGIVHITVKGLHNRINQIKYPFIIGQARRPDALARSHAPQIQLTGSVQRIFYQLPVDQIPGMVQPYARPPLKGGRCYVVIVVHPNDGRIRMKAPQYGILNLHNALLFHFGLPGQSALYLQFSFLYSTGVIFSEALNTLEK